MSAWVCRECGMAYRPIPFDEDVVRCSKCIENDELRTSVLRYRHALQRIMQVLGPSVPKNVNYSDQWNALGLITEQEEALRILMSVGVEYQHRKRKPDKQE